MISSLNFSPHYFNISFKGNNDKKYSTKPLDYDTFVKSKNQVSKICNVTAQSQEGHNLTCDLPVRLLII